jgi:hypothetical protein
MREDYRPIPFSPSSSISQCSRSSRCCANGFTNFIATGGSSNFVREYSGKVYDIPPEPVCGTAQANTSFARGWAVSFA